MALSVWGEQPFASLALALPALLRRAVETHGHWTIVEAYDADCATTKRRTPTGGAENDFDNVAFSAGGDFGWQTDTMGNGDWIILRSTGAVNFQVYFEYDSATELKHAAITFDDFATGGADVTPPVFPATAIGSTMGTSPTLVGATTVAGVMRYSLETSPNAIFMQWRNGTPSDTEDVNIALCPSAYSNDTRAVVIKDRPDLARVNNAYSAWNRVAPDGVTFLNNGIAATLKVGNSTIMTSAGHDVLGTRAAGAPGDEKTILPFIIFFQDAGHRHALILEGNYKVGKSAAVDGTTDDLNIMYWTDSATSARRAIEWDGVTVV